MSRMIEVSKALLLEKRGNIDGTRFLYSIGFHDGIRVKQEFQNIDFSKLEDIDDAELRKKIELLDVIHEDWCIEYLGKFLNSGRNYYDRQDYMKNHHHVWAMEALSNFAPEKIESQISNYLNKLDFDIPMGSCDSDMYFNIATSNYAYDIAMEIGVRNKYSCMESVLKTFLPALRWATHGFGAAEAKWLVELKGIDAFDDLVGYLNWHHRKYECWDQVDNRVVDAIVSIGPDAVPLLREHLYEEHYSPNLAALEAIEKLGEDPTDYVNLLATEGSDGYNTDIKELEFLSSRSVERMHEKFVNFLNYYIYDIKTVSDIITKSHLTIDNRIMMDYLNEESTIRGVCKYFQDFPTPDVIKPLTVALSVPSNDPYVAEEIIRTLTKNSDPDLLAKLLKWSSDLLSSEISLSNTPVIKTLCILDETISWISSDQSNIIEPIAIYLNSESEDDRIVAIFFIGLISTNPTGLKQLQAAGLQTILDQLFHQKTPKDYFNDFKDNKAFYGLWLPRITNISNNKITHEDADSVESISNDTKIHEDVDSIESISNDTKIHEDVDSIENVANEIRYSRTPWLVISEAKASFDLNNAILKSAVIDSIPNLLNGMTNRGSIIKILEAISDIDYLIQNKKFLDGLSDKILSQSDLSSPHKINEHFVVSPKVLLEMTPMVFDNPKFQKTLAFYAKAAVSRTYNRDLFNQLYSNQFLLELGSIKDVLRKCESDLLFQIKSGTINAPLIKVMTKITGKNYVDKVADVICDQATSLKTIMKILSAFPEIGEEKRIRNFIRDFVEKTKKSCYEGKGPRVYIIIDTFNVFSRLPGIINDKSIQNSIDEFFTHYKIRR